MKTAQKVIKVQVGVLELAKQGGTVSQACKVIGYSRDSCQDLAQTTHQHVITEKSGKPALEEARQRVQRGKVHPNQPSLFPVAHPRHRPDLLPQPPQAIAPHATPEVGQTTAPRLAPQQEVVGKARQEQHEVLGFPAVLPPFDNPEAVLVLTKRGLAPRSTLVRIGYGHGLQLGHRRDQGGILLPPAFLLGRAHHPLAGGAAAAGGA
jgi:hypothetical protein